MLLPYIRAGFTCPVSDKPRTPRPATVYRSRVSRLDDIAASLDARARDVEELRAGITAARVLADELRTEFARVAVRDKTRQAADIIARLDGAAGRLAAVLQRLHQARRQVDVARGEGGTVGGSAGTTGQFRPPFKPMRTDPDKRDEITPYVGLDYAVATLWDSVGNQVVGVHQAADDGPAATAKWRAPWGQYPRLRRHVEAHAAARMKPGDTMVMYINMKACGYPDGCKKNLRDIIPKGSTLVIHRVWANGTVTVTPYEGNGRAYRD